MKEKLSIDKTKWIPVKFGDVVFEPKDSSQDPIADGIEYVVGLEHIESGSIHLRNSASIEESTTFTKRFAIGDVLFGRRRAYLKKAAQASFSGICSGDITVFRAKKNLLPELLPFIVSNEKFFDYAIKHSAGGLSPRVKFKDLANYEFLLPPKDQQAQLAELLWAMDEVIELEGRFLGSIIAFKQIKREELIIEPVSDWVNLEAICEKKISYGIVQAGPHVETGMPYIKSSDLSPEGIIASNLQRTSKEIAEKYKRSEVNPGDIVFSLRGNLGEMNIVPRELPIANLTQGTARLNVKGKFNTYFVKHALETGKVQSRIHALSKGSTFKEVSLEALRTVKIPIPKSYDIQIQISQILNSTDKAIKGAKYKIFDSKSLQKSLINQIF